MFVYYFQLLAESPTGEMGSMSYMFTTDVELTTGSCHLAAWIGNIRTVNPLERVNTEFESNFLISCDGYTPPAPDVSYQLSSFRS